LGSELTETAVFGQATFYLRPDFDIAIGARIAEIESSVALTDGPGLIVANLPETTDGDTVDTYSFTARYRPNDDLSLYARIASGYRPQNANLPLMSGGVNVAPLIIATDTLWSYEAGAKGELLDGVIRYDLAVWYNDWQNPQAVTFVNAATTGGNANSDITAYGFEGAVQITPTTGLSIIGSLSYAHSTLDSDETAAFGALEGENLALLPEWSAALRAQYDFPITASIDGFVGGGVRYVGERDTGYNGGVGSGGGVITPKIANFTLEEYVVANLAAGLRAGPVEARLYVNNLLDEYGYTGGSARPIVGGVRATANVLQPRTIGVALSYAF
jgi:outer membrane receptor protein involved in Fe transport